MLIPTPTPIHSVLEPHSSPKLAPQFFHPPPGGPACAHSGPSTRQVSNNCSYLACRHLLPCHPRVSSVPMPILPVDPKLPWGSVLCPWSLQRLASSCVHGGGSGQGLAKAGCSPRPCARKSGCFWGHKLGGLVSWRPQPAAVASNCGPSTGPGPSFPDGIMRRFLRPYQPESL